MFAAGITDQFKQDILRGLHQPGDIYKVALYLQAFAPTLNKSLAGYTSVGELATAGGYTRDSRLLKGLTIGISLGTAYMDFDDVSWVNASFSADAALIYNASRKNAAIAVMAFPTTTATNGPFILQFPPAGSFAAITIS